MEVATIQIYTAFISFCIFQMTQKPLLYEYLSIGIELK